MCTYINGILAAFTGTLPPMSTPTSKSLVIWTIEPVATLVTSAEREPIRFDGPDYEERHSGHRTNGKGGWIARNRGRKPEYKDRHLRAAGSGKTRATSYAC